MQYYGLSGSIMSDYGSVFTSKFWFSLCYFFGIKQKLSTAFYPQTDGQTKKENSIVKAYLRAFVNYEQDNWAQLLLMAEFAYNNAKNASISHMLFELNCRYYSQTYYKKDVNPRLQSKSVDKQVTKLKQLMIIYRKNL